MSRLLFLFLLFWFSPAFSADAKLAQDGVELFVSARTPEQMRAFYGARGMPPAALQEISKACFLTVGVRNRRAKTLWLEPAAWRFFDANGKPIAHISRQQWKARWVALQVPLAAQSTFGWTQLPESRDLYPDESAGANISIVPPAGSFSLVARFRSGANGDGPMIELTVPNLSCSREGAGQ
jgi:hypothetical protein